MDRQIVVYPYNGILLSKKKEQIIDTKNMNQPQKHYMKKARHNRLHTVSFHL